MYAWTSAPPVIDSIRPQATQTHPHHTHLFFLLGRRRRPPALPPLRLRRGWWRWGRQQLLLLLLLRDEGHEEADDGTAVVRVEEVEEGAVFRVCVCVCVCVCGKPMAMPPIRPD